MSQKLTYKDSGVDIEAGYKSVELIKKHIKKTMTSGVVSDIGGFGGLFAIDKEAYEQPVLVSGTDGVGTKLKVAFMSDVHNTIGEDCVAMCVNDVICQGAKPLFFLDYVATGKLSPEKLASIVEGIANGCVKSGSALIGGETAEMPGLYSDGEYDVAGFSVGIVDRNKIINGSKISEGDVLLGLPSSGLHSNGFSLVRKAVFEVGGYKIDDYIEELGCTIGEELLKPTRIYKDPLVDMIEKFEVRGLSHVTGGGFYENIPRMIPEGLCANVTTENIDTPKIFDFIQKIGNIETSEMYNTFNMGVGMVIAASKEEASKIKTYLEEKEEKYYELGNVIKSEGDKKICLTI